MTDRKPHGLSWESWVDRQIREATERGDFDNLPTGRLKSLQGPYKDDWWLKEMVAREGVSHTHPHLELRRRAERELEDVLRLAGESAVRKRIEALNAEIRESNRTNPGPLPPIPLVDIEQVVAAWRKRREAEA